MKFARYIVVGTLLLLACGAFYGIEAWKSYHCRSRILEAVQGASSSSPSERRNAVSILCSYSDRVQPEDRGAVIACVLSSLEDPDPSVREMGVLAIRLFTPEATAAVPTLIRLLKDPDVEVVLPTISLLADLGKGANDALPELERLASGQDVNREVRINARRAVEFLRTSGSAGK
jgi:HEAT repeat protein